MLEPEVLILELKTVDALATCTIALCEVTPLTHELGYDPVKRAAFEVELLVGSTHTPLSSAQSTEIFSCPWDDVSPQLHDNPACRLATYLYVKEHPEASGTQVRRY